MVNFPTWICDSHSPALLDLFLLILVLVLQWLFLHWEILIIDSPTNSKWDGPFHCIAYDYSHADWDSLCNHLRDVPWEDIFKLRASAADSEFCERVQVGIDIYIPQHKYQIKPHSSPWSLTACAAAIVHRNHFFSFY